MVPAAEQGSARKPMMHEIVETGQGLPVSKVKIAWQKSYSRGKEVFRNKS
jgi:hypothetical protein